MKKVIFMMLLTLRCVSGSLNIWAGYQQRTQDHWDSPDQSQHAPVLGSQDDGSKIMCKNWRYDAGNCHRRVPAGTSEQKCCSGCGGDGHTKECNEAYRCKNDGCERSLPSGRIEGGLLTCCCLCDDKAYQIKNPKTPAQINQKDQYATLDHDHDEECRNENSGFRENAKSPKPAVPAKGKSERICESCNTYKVHGTPGPDVDFDVAKYCCFLCVHDILYQRNPANKDEWTQENFLHHCGNFCREPDEGWTPPPGLLAVRREAGDDGDAGADGGRQRSPGSPEADPGYYMENGDEIITDWALLPTGSDDEAATFVPPAKISKKHTRSKVPKISDATNVQVTGHKDAAPTRTLGARRGEHSQGARDSKSIPGNNSPGTKKESVFTMRNISLVLCLTVVFVIVAKWNAIIQMLSPTEVPKSVLPFWN